jgi:hypothetical protein
VEGIAIEMKEKTDKNNEREMDGQRQRVQK